MISPCAMPLSSCNAPAYSRRASFYRSEEHTSELQSLRHLVCRLLLENRKAHLLIPGTWSARMLSSAFDLTSTVGRGTPVCYSAVGVPMPASARTHHTRYNTSSCRDHS